MYLYYNFVCIYMIQIFYSIVDGTQSDSAIDVSQAEEERSFLKIENVISLAPRSDNIRNENPIVSEEYIYIRNIIILLYSIYHIVITLFHYYIILR